MSDSLKPMLALLAYLPAASREAMVRMYRSALTDQLALIAAALESEPQAALAPLHKIGGAAGMMQDHALSQAAREAENALRDGAVEAARAEKWPRLQTCAKTSLDGLAQAFPGMPD